MRLSCASGLREAALTDISFARNAWCPLSWQSIKLRIGPDYKTRKAKAPTRSPLLECCGVDLFRMEQKVVTSLGHAHAPYLPKEVMRAANGGECMCDLPKYLVVSISIPGYASSQADGPGIKLMWCAPCDRPVRAGRGVGQRWEEVKWVRVGWSCSWVVV